MHVTWHNQETEVWNVTMFCIGCVTYWGTYEMYTEFWWGTVSEMAAWGLKCSIKIYITEIGCGDRKTIDLCDISSYLGSECVHESLLG